MNAEQFFVPVDVQQRKEQQKKRFDKIANQIWNGLNDLKTAKTNDPKEQLFIDLFKKLTIKAYFEKKLDFIFFVDKNNKVFVEYDLKINTFWCSYKYIWSIFEKQFDRDDWNIQLFIKKQTEKYFNLKDVKSMRNLLFGQVYFEIF